MPREKREFTDDALVVAYAKVKAEGGTIDDVVAKLGLNKEKGRTQITNARTKLRKIGVVFPTLRRKGSETGLTPEKVASYNETMNPAPPVETEETASS